MINSYISHIQSSTKTVSLSHRIGLAMSSLVSSLPSSSLPLIVIHHVARIQGGWSLCYLPRIFVWLLVCSVVYFTIYWRAFWPLRVFRLRRVWRWSRPEGAISIGCVSTRSIHNTDRYCKVNTYATVLGWFTYCRNAWLLLLVRFTVSHGPPQVRRDKFVRGCVGVDLTS